MTKKKQQKTKKQKKNHQKQKSRKNKKVFFSALKTIIHVRTMSNWDFVSQNCMTKE